MLPELSVESFREYVHHRHSKPTAIKYAQAANKFLLFCGRHRLSIDKLPPGVLSVFADSLLAEGMKLSSVRATVSGVAKYINWCRTRGSDLPVMASPDLPRGHRPPPRVLHTKGLLGYFAIASRLHEPIRTSLLLLPYCGLRSHELVKLQLRDIRAMKVNGVEMLALSVVGKGGKHRTVPVLEEGKPFLLAYLRGWRVRNGGRSPYLFPMGDGRPLSERTIRHHVLAISKRIGENKLTAHTLRRTYLTTLHRHGIDVPTLTKIAGHSSVQTTMDHYLAIEPETLAGAVTGVRLVEKGERAEQMQKARAGLTDLLGSLPPLFQPNKKDPSE